MLAYCLKILYYTYDYYIMYKILINRYCLGLTLFLTCNLNSDLILIPSWVADFFSSGYS